MNILLQLSSVRIQLSLFLTVPNSENSPDTSNPTVAKLLEVDAELSTQEVELSAQLKSIQEKRHSLKTVIDLFAPTDTATATPIATPAQTPVVEAEAEVVEEQVEPTTQDEATPELDQPNTDITVDTEPQAVPAIQKRQAKKNSAPASKSQVQNPCPRRQTQNERLGSSIYERSSATLP